MPMLRRVHFEEKNKAKPTQYSNATLSMPPERGTLKVPEGAAVVDLHNTP